MSPYIRAFSRFWWVIFLGELVAVVVVMLATYHVDLSSFTFTERSQPTYTASQRLLVTSPQAPYFRTTVTSRVVEPSVAGPRTVTDRPETNTLIQAANLYPLLIESDAVTRLRERLYGPLPGSVTARALFSVRTPNRYEPSAVPVIEVIAEADTPEYAIRLAQRTGDAFRRWIIDAQDRARLPAKDRIVIEQIQEPRSATATGGLSRAFPILVLFAVLLAFATLVVLLDRLFPGDAEEGESELARLGRRRGVSKTA